MTRVATRIFIVSLSCSCLASIAIPTRAWGQMAPQPQEPLDVSAFVDTYAAINYGFPKPQRDASSLHAYDATTGFSLAWLGLDLRYDIGDVAATADLRFGPGTPVLAGSDAGTGLEYVSQAFATWRPGGPTSGFRLDFGKFETIFGAEYNDTQPNMTYTRGLMYTLATPGFHTGIHGTFEPWDAVGLHALVVNGWSNSIDNNAGKSFGAQIHIALPDRDKPMFQAWLGYLGGPERDDVATVTCPPDFSLDPNRGCVSEPGSEGGSFPVDAGAANLKGWRHLADFVGEVSPTDWLTILLNGDLVVERVRRDDDLLSFRTVSWYGAYLGARFQLTNVWAVAGRGEVLGDPDGQLTAANHPTLASGTLTLEAVPTKHLLIRLDNRVDAADEPLFRRRLRDTSRHQVTSTLGLIVSTD